MSGLQDKRTNSIWTDLGQFAPRRLLSQTMVKAGNAVYAWRYNQVTQNVTIDIGKVHFSVSQLHSYWLAYNCDLQVLGCRICLL